MTTLSGTVTESLDPTDWVAYAHRIDTGVLVGMADVAAGAYSIDCGAVTEACLVTVAPKMGAKWKPSEVIAIGDYRVPTSTGVTPYIFKCVATEAGAISAARYWRMRSITVASTYLEPSEIQMHSAAGNENSVATVTASPSPSSFSVSEIVDGSLSNRAFWSSSSVPDLVLHWDFGGSPKAIIGIKIGGFDTSGRTPDGCIVESSINDVDWTTIGILSGLSYPGNYTLSPLLPLTAPPLTGSTEPAWPAVVGNTVVDGGVTWQCVSRMIQPITHGPLVPA